MKDLEKEYLDVKVKDSHVDTVIFDIGNVLATYQERNFFKLRGYDDKMADKLALATVRDPIWQEVDRSAKPFKEYVQIMMNNNPDIAKDIEYALSDTSMICTRKEKSIDWILDIKKKGRRVLYLSNYGKELFENSQKELDCLKYTDGGLVSYEVKLIKPDKAIFMELFKRFDLDPSKCVFIDDSIKNVIGASKCGLQTIHCKNQEQAIADLDKLLLL